MIKSMIAIYKYRIALNMSQAQLAKIVGVVPSTINQYESGARKPDIIMLKKLAQALHTTADELLQPIKCDN
jgi:transcriptional regulator with XRE-family HTH domain